MGDMRLDSFLAKAGVCSRRKAKQLILSGRVEVNRTAICEQGVRVDVNNDLIIVDGKKISLGKEKSYILLNKPKGFISTVSDGRGRKTVLDLVRGINKRVYPVGRLDKDTTGLLILTNDGELTNRLTHPRYNVEKTYEIKIKGDLSDKDRIRLEKGAFIDNKKTAPAKIAILHKSHAASIVRIKIHEGRKKQVRLMFQYLGYPVLSLKRIKVGALGLGTLKPGEFRFLTEKEVQRLYGR